MRIIYFLTTPCNTFVLFGIQHCPRNNLNIPNTRMPIALKRPQIYMIITIYTLGN